MSLTLSSSVKPPQPYTQHQHPHVVQPLPPNTLKYPGPAPQRAYAPYPVGVMYGAPPPPQALPVPETRSALAVAARWDRCVWTTTPRIRVYYYCFASSLLAWFSSSEESGTLLLRGRFWGSEWIRIRKSGLIVSVAYDVTHRGGVEHAGCTEAGAPRRITLRPGAYDDNLDGVDYLLRGTPRWESSRCLRTLCDVGRRIWSQGGATSKRADVLARERFHRLFCWGLRAEFFLPESALGRWVRHGCGNDGANARMWRWVGGRVGILYLRRRPLGARGD
ncbi:hypothetical protein B0H14DRAFT_3894274 [Mycena olivaceomarginata]|nr:hypothetical protein B0H14DRAFT_3894274 [Mycena olivaceomarginata]